MFMSALEGQRLGIPLLSDNLSTEQFDGVCQQNPCSKLYLECPMVVL
jgi:hypothetical protein